MLPGSHTLSSGLKLRPANQGDAPFLAALYRSTRDDLRLINAEDEFIETLITLQANAQTQGYGEDHPEAFTFIIEKLGESIGRVMVEFKETEVRLLEIAIIPAARGLNFGSSILHALQQAAETVKTPLTLYVLRQNALARQFYFSLGFQVATSSPMMDFLIWYPQPLRTNPL